MTQANKRHLWHSILLAVLLAALLAPAPPAWANSYIVTSLVDNQTNDGLCTLREAIRVANSEVSNNDCGSSSTGNDTITFSVSGIIRLITPLPAIRHASLYGKLTINGGGQITISGDTDGNGTGDVQVFSVENGGDLTLQDLTVTHGRAVGYGGGVYNDGTLTINNSTFSDNRATLDGGAIFAMRGQVTINNSTFSGNSAVNGGAIYLTGLSTLTMGNSTLAGNHASSAGGGIHAGSTATLQNTLIADNTGGNCSGNAFTAASTHNMATDNTCGASFTQVTSAQLDLGSLTGDPAYLPLNSGSAAIDAGTNTGCPATDQRGAARPVDGDGDATATCDIGAYEFIPSLYVDASATGANDGSSWADAFTSLQDALGQAQIGTAIWVAAGVYYPDEGSSQTNDNRNATFTLQNGVAIYGGFAGTETQLSDRDLALNITVLSGDIDHETNPDTTDPTGVVTDTAQIRGANAYHVVTGSGTDNTTVLDGVVITAGQANGSGLKGRGGGVYNGGPTLVNVTFSGNWANVYGGGMYSDGDSTLVNVTFRGNRSAQAGGGMYNHSGGRPTLTNVTFSGNRADFDGGGMYNTGSSPTLTNVTFSSNYAGSNGGGMYNVASSPTLINVLIANSTGGGDCVNLGGSSLDPSSTHNLIENPGTCAPLPGSGNITGQDPNLGSLTDFGGPGRQVHPLLNSSPAIDAGTNTDAPTTDQRGVARPQGAQVDIGAYEYEVVCYDFQPDGQVNALDIQVVAGHWRKRDTDPDWDMVQQYDLDGDGAITIADLMQVAAQWGPCP